MRIVRGEIRKAGRLPLGFRHDSLTPWYRSDWCLLKCLVRFLTMGIREAIYGEIMVNTGRVVQETVRWNEWDRSVCGMR